MGRKFVIVDYPEGATPIHDANGLIPSWIGTHADLNRAEAENILSATSEYLIKSVPPAPSWFNIPTLCDMHYAMFHSVWDWAGRFRTVQTNIGVPSYQIRGHLEELCRDVTFWSGSVSRLTFVEQSARVHHRLVSIHPFNNGNGRFSRFVADLYLKSSKSQLPVWPIDLAGNGEPRRQYLACLKEADRGHYYI